jgi:hypothetical protein
MGQPNINHPDIVQGTMRTRKQTPLLTLKFHSQARLNGAQTRPRGLASTRTASTLCHINRHCSYLRASSAPHLKAYIFSAAGDVLPAVLLALLSRPIIDFITASTAAFCMRTAPDAAVPRIVRRVLRTERFLAINFLPEKLAMHLKAAISAFVPLFFGNYRTDRTFST